MHLNALLVILSAAAAAVAAPAPVPVKASDPVVYTGAEIVARLALASGATSALNARDEDPDYCYANCIIDGGSDWQCICQCVACGGNTPPPEEQGS